MNDDDREDLKKFLDEFAELIGDVLAKENEHWFPRDLREPLRRVWKTDVSPKIETIKTALDARQNETALVDAGLTGDQLRLKLDAWRHARDAARSGPLSKAPRKWWQSVLGWLGLALRPLQGALKIANAILESIGLGFPPAHAVSEFKKILEGLLDLDEGRGPMKKLRSWVTRRFGRS